MLYLLLLLLSVLTFRLAWPSFLFYRTGDTVVHAFERR